MGKINRDKSDEYPDMDGDIVWRYKLYAAKLSPPEQRMIEFYRTLSPVQKV